MHSLNNYFAFYKNGTVISNIPFVLFLAVVVKPVTYLSKCCI